MIASPQASPMSLAEANECCGQYRWADWALDAWTLDAYCENCPLLIERREHPEVLRAARAM